MKEVHPSETQREKRDRKLSPNPAVQLILVILEYYLSVVAYLQIISNANQTSTSLHFSLNIAFSLLSFFFFVTKIVAYTPAQEMPLPWTSL